MTLAAMLTRMRDSLPHMPTLALLPVFIPAHSKGRKRGRAAAVQQHMQAARAAMKRARKELERRR